jgi:hypothetical protein
MKLVAAQYEHILPLLEQMGVARRQEMVAIGEHLSASPADMVCSSLDNSAESFVCIDDGDPVAMGGVVGIPTGGFCWMIASTPRLERHKKWFLSESRSQCERLADAYGNLYVDVAAEEAKSIRWLGWLGFRMTAKYTAFGRDVCRLERRA